MADNPLTKLPLAGQLGVSVLVAGIIGGVFYYQFWAPMVEDETKKRRTLSALGDEIRQLEVIKNRQAEFLKELEQRKNKLDLLKRILPADKETPELMKKVQYLATQVNLNIKKFNPGATVTKQFEVAPPPPKPGTPPPPPGQPKPPAQQGDSYQEWPINVDVEGTYHNLGSFLYKVSRLSRLVNMGNIKIRAQATPRAANTVAVSCVATTYVYVEAPRPAPGAPGTQGQP